MINIKTITTDSDYKAALKEIETLMMAEADTPEGEKLDVMVTLIEAYESELFPLDLTDPVEPHQTLNEAKRPRLGDCTMG